MTSIILSESGFRHGAVTEGMDEASWEWGVKEGRNGKAAGHLMTEWYHGGDFGDWW